MSGFFSPSNVDDGRLALVLRFERDLPSGAVAVDTVELKVWRVTKADRFDPEIRTSSRTLKTELFEPRRWGPFSWWSKKEETK